MVASDTNAAALSNPSVKSQEGSQDQNLRIDEVSSVTVSENSSVQDSVSKYEGARRSSSGVGSEGGIATNAL